MWLSVGHEWNDGRCPGRLQLAWPSRSGRLGVPERIPESVAADLELSIAMQKPWGYPQMDVFWGKMRENPIYKSMIHRWIARFFRKPPFELFLNGPWPTFACWGMSCTSTMALERVEALWIRSMPETQWEPINNNAMNGREMLQQPDAFFFK